MKYPCLVLKAMCTTDMIVSVDQEGVSVYGEPLTPTIVSVKGNYQEKTKTIYTAQKKEVTVSALVMFPGDIVPDMETISGGSVTIRGYSRRIAQGSKARNPDGTVNYTEVWLE